MRSILLSIIRRGFVTIVATGAFGFLAHPIWSQTVTQKENTVSQLATLQLDAVPQTATAEIRPFHFTATEQQLADLRRRIVATKWPEPETVRDATQGVQLATMQELAHYWATDYNWRKVEARLNALPQFVTN